ncbi:Lipase family protein [Trichomonas vaginalis G3]|uniref:Lipase family protein n=1 Tax=Trichomonas vaginalis (strain ATCC PRA-98 / G3) TaxID=412133 RepID=A2F8P9_TRIV3|nr:lipase [Trichomonas vaginalis G3]EAX98727.1 Lipase family protein [Trichomonas vaginalis G3]KAI5538491.1 lipase class 3 protein-like family [Trichomonas vaginalis G3]|eukprot:XP_001311657.1 lipase [Trichomonas vaginalis G3]
MDYEARLNKEYMLHCLNILAHFDGVNLPAGVTEIKAAGGQNEKLPVYFIASEGNDYFVCTRGATDANDFEIVLEIDLVPFLNGKAHKGILDAARKIVEDNEEILKQCKGQIHVIGHSLGAATSIGVSTVLRLEKHYTNVDCYNFAQFPVFSKEIADQTRDWMTSVIYGEDIVPKVTNKNVSMPLNAMAPPGPNQAQAIQGLKSTIAGMMQNIVAGQGVTDKQQLNNVAAVLDVKLDKLVEMATNVDPQSPTLSGTLLHVVQRTDYWTGVTSYHVIPYDENMGINFFGLMIGVQQHYIKFYSQVLHKAYDKQEAPAAKEPTAGLDLD